MKNLISKELLLELKLFDNIENREYRYEVNGNTLKVVYNITNCFDGNWFIINIYELGFKLKEWAKNNSYTIISGYDNDYMGEKYNKRVFGYCCQIQDKEFNIKDFYAEDELNAIIEACEWVRKELLK